MAARGPFGRSKLFDLVRRGILPARKIEGTTFVLKADWIKFLEGAPLAIEQRRLLIPDQVKAQLNNEKARRWRTGLRKQLRFERDNV